jgi:four helix bundle protein
MQDFRNLKIWQRSHQLVLSLYKLTAKFPKDEVYALTSQIRRAAASIPANIAEGCVKGSDADFARFLHIALGSASELDYHLLLSRDLSYCTGAEYDGFSKELHEIRSMLGSLLLRLKPSR